MNDTRVLIEDTAARIFRDLCTKETVDAAEKGQWPAGLWQALEESGLVLAAVPEEYGGGGCALGDQMALLRLAGRFAAPLPLTETFLAGWLLSKAGRTAPPGPMTAACASDAEPRIDNVPFAGEASRIVVLVRTKSGAHLVNLEKGGYEIRPGKNLAGEPRDTLLLNHATLDGLSSTPVEIDEAAFTRMGALCRVAQMAGALERILELTIEHANVRVQFGRPIGSFQAVRQQIAALAAQVAAASVAADAAVAAAERGEGAVEIAAAKARVGEAAGVAAAIAHQVHGAMGITYEHLLHQYTRRLWSWRDEFGPETRWQRELGRALTARGADQLWSFITRT